MVQMLNNNYYFYRFQLNVELSEPGDDGSRFASHTK